MKGNLLDILTKHTIKAILFDYDGTLRENTPSIIDRITKILKDAGYEVDNETIKTIVRQGHAFWSDRARVNAFKQSSQDERAFWINYFKIFLSVIDLPDKVRTGFCIQLGEKYIDERYSTDAPFAICNSDIE